MTLRGGSVGAFVVALSLLRELFAEVVRQKGVAVLEEKRCKRVLWLNVSVRFLYYSLRSMKAQMSILAGGRSGGGRGNESRWPTDLNHLLLGRRLSL
jgi:hypothetical protein